MRQRDDNHRGGAGHGGGWGRRGSALILVMLVLLITSALGMVALHDVTGDVRRSGMFRVRAQAQEGSNALLGFSTQLAGDSADTYVEMMRKSSQQRSTITSSTTSRCNIEVAKGSSGFAQLCRVYDGGALEDDLSDALNPTTMSEESGLFGDDSLEKGRDDEITYRVIMRDPIDVPATGHGGDSTSRYCYKLVQVATEYNLGSRLTTATPGWDSYASSGRHVGDALIGPFPCGAAR